MEEIKPIVDLGGRVSSFSVPAYNSFKEYIGFENCDVCESITLLNTIGEFPEAVYEVFDCNIRRVYLNPPSSFRLEIASDGSFLDEWGVKYTPNGPFNERTRNPLKNARNISELDTYSWPDPEDPGRVSHLRATIDAIKKNGKLIISAGHVSAGIFQDCWNLRGMQLFLEDLLLRREFAMALLEKVTNVHIGLWKSFLSVVGNDIYMVETADDLGTQNGMLISPRIYREMIKPFHRRLNLAIRAKTDAKILFHSCGAIDPVINDLLEIGVQILNPIQPIKGKMDPEMLKEKYGDKLCFHGGLDVQNLLINGTPDEINEHVNHYFDVFGSENYIMAPTNSIQPGTPPENVLAAYEAAKQFKF